jgi:hypothetical protein
MNYAFLILVDLGRPNQFKVFLSLLIHLDPSSHFQLSRLQISWAIEQATGLRTHSKTNKLIEKKKKKKKKNSFGFALLILNPKTCHAHAQTFNTSQAISHANEQIIPR